MTIPESAWPLLRFLQQPDYALLLPGLGRLPLRIGWRLATLRGRLNAWLGRDWRSVALGTAHVYRRTLTGYTQLAPLATTADRQRWCRERFMVESRNEYEAARLDAKGLEGLHFDLDEVAQEFVRRPPDRGLLLLTPHFDSFYLGAAFIAISGQRPVNSMASGVFRDPRVAPAVTWHFTRRYAALERHSRGGRIIELENGLRPFYRILAAGQVLVVLADAPVLPNGASMTVDFLGGPRRLAGGAIRLAQGTGSEIGGYVCSCTGPGRYLVRGCRPGPPDDPETLTRLYGFFESAIKAQPGAWLAADLLPDMPLPDSEGRE